MGKLLEIILGGGIKLSLIKSSMIYASIKIFFEIYLSLTSLRGLKVIAHKVIFNEISLMFKTGTINNRRWNTISLQAQI